MTQNSGTLALLPVDAMEISTSQKAKSPHHPTYTISCFCVVWIVICLLTNDTVEVFCLFSFCAGIKMLICDNITLRDGETFKNRGQERKLFKESQHGVLLKSFCIAECL